MMMIRERDVEKIYIVYIKKFIGQKDLQKQNSSKLKKVFYGKTSASPALFIHPK